MTTPSIASHTAADGRRVSPHVPPPEHADLAAIGGRIGPASTDFVVDEVPLYAASGQGDHWYVRVRKERATTLELVRAIASAARVGERDVGYAGMKDKHAVTTQWLSVPSQAPVPPSAWQLPQEFELLEVSRHTNKLRTGHLEANRFRIRVIDVVTGALAAARALCERVRAQGVANYFGHQRFGVGQNNLEVALDALARRQFERQHPKRKKLMASVVQSEIFNRYLTARLEQGRERVLPGDVLRLSGRSSLFLAEDAERETERLVRGEVHLTGPMWGPKMREASGAPLELERRALESLGLEPPALATLGRSAPGTRRDLVIRPLELSCEAEGDDAIVFELVLPAGAYATVVIAAFTRSGEPRAVLEGAASAETPAAEEAEA